MSVNQRDVTRNQSTADYSHSCIFLFDNRFREEVLTLAEGETPDDEIQEGKLVVRNGTKISFATSANLANVIGILKFDGEMTLTSDLNVNIGTKGTIDQTLLVLPATVTLNTVVGSKTLRDVLEGIGFHLENVTEHTDFVD